MDLIVCIVLMFAALLFTVWSGGQLFFATGFGLALFCIYALRHGNSPRQLGAMLMVGVKKALVVILALLLVGVRLVGLRPMCVLSGSMEPTYHTGSLIYVKPCAPEDVQVGDPITFVLNEDLDVVTHRVVSIDAENQHFYTKGDANDAPDGAPVYFKNLIGRPVFTIPYLGYVSHWVSNPPGMYLAIALALVLIILTFLPDVLRKASEADARDAARRAADKPGDAPDAKSSGENMEK